ncbi:hypothetical protein BJ138DRAFT_1094051 [Hygrophoropsis aurantiaca]|uniref:Uncharacterized protein n=1 Tax=Hygrophoropsis aurantiaca TaxID=72124 RepID=A0ACB8A054_9AGAM|nr:hypothetical protein BJ138DRAFT_1094051 [Hygrophoropsis aurantiaca]
MAPSTTTPERAAELRANLAFVNAQINKAVSGSNPPHRPQLIAVSSEWPVQDVRVLYDAGHRDFGEHRVDQIRGKASVLPSDIRWHFIGAQPEGKGLAEIPNLCAVKAITSQKAANELNDALSPARRPLNVYIQVNTSREAEKKGLEPLHLSSASSSPTTSETTPQAPEESTTLAQLALHIVRNCPRLRLLGLMTIGSSAEARIAFGAGADDNNNDSAAPNADFETLRATQAVLEGVLRTAGVSPDGVSPNGEGVVQGPLLLSMGTSADYAAAVRAGSDVVRVGTPIFG